MAILALFLVTLSAYAVHYGWAKRARQQRELTYQATLRSYSETLKPGMTRKDVEAFLRRKGKRFTQWLEGPGPLRDLTKIGEESAPWYCSEHHVYVAFDFVAAQPRESGQADDADTLKTVRLLHQLGGCL